MDNCKLLIYDDTINESIWIDGEVIGKRNSYPGEEFPYRYDVKTERGTFEGCHPVCIDNKK